MVNYFIYAKDFSASTHRHKHYHTNGLNTLDEFKRDVETIKKELLIAEEAPTESKIIYLHWGDKCYEVDEDTITVAYTNMDCAPMATEPETIPEWIRRNCDINDNNKFKLLYIITDGFTSPISVRKCFKLNENINYEAVVFHAFNEDLNEVNLSIAAPFLTSRCMIYRNYELIKNFNITDEFDYGKINADNFETEIDKLDSYIKLKYINTLTPNSQALQEINKLNELRERLLVELKLKAQKNAVDLDTRDRDVFLSKFVSTNWYNNLIDPAAYDAKMEAEKATWTYINHIISHKKCYPFDALLLKTDFQAKEEPIVDINFTDEQEIEFPDIIQDDDKGIPVILLTEFNLTDKIIKNTSNAPSAASLNEFKSAIDCPLLLLKDPDINESMSYSYTLNAYKELLNTTTKTDPRNQKPFHGGIVLTCTEEYDKYNDYVLSATYFGSKKINYNIGLFYFVLWKYCESKEWMDKNVVEQFKKYVMRRISRTVCKVGLSMLPQDPHEDTSLPTALWYCLELSSCLFKDDPLHYMHERLRTYYDVAHYMIEILKYFNYDLRLDTIDKRRDLIRDVLILKEIPTQREKVYYLLRRIFKNDNGFLVSEIENPFYLNHLNYLKFDHKAILCDDVIKEKVHLNNYVYLMHFVDHLNKSGDGIGKGVFEICEKTFRPFFSINENETSYTELVKITKKVIINNDDDPHEIKITYDAVDSLDFNKILSLYQLFINCVKDSGKYPTLPEYIEYISIQKKYCGDLITIFSSSVYFGAAKVYSLYQNIMAKVDVSEFIEVCRNYVKRLERVKAEDILKFNNDKEIAEYIFKLDLKVQRMTFNELKHSINVKKLKRKVNETNKNKL